MKYIHIIACLLLGSNVVGQSAIQILDKYIELKKNEKEYQVDINYSLYKGMNGKKALETYSGFQAKFNEVVYQKLNVTESIVGKDFMIKLSADEKAILIGFSSKPLINDLNQIDNLKVLAFFEHKSIEDLNTQWKLVLRTNKNEALSQFSKIEIYLQKESLRLTKQVFYYALASDFSIYQTEKSDPELDIARLEISFTNFKNKVISDKKKFSRDHYFKYINNKIEVAEAYKGFEILYAN